VNLRVSRVLDLCCRDGVRIGYVELALEFGVLVEEILDSGAELLGRVFSGQSLDSLPLKVDSLRRYSTGRSPRRSTMSISANCPSAFRAPSGEHCARSATTPAG